MATNLSALIIDDDVGDRKLIKRHLCQCTEEISVSQAGSGVEAIEMVDAHFDIIFCDNHMPGIEGVLLLKKLRAKWPQASIVLMSGRGDELLAKDSIRAGATDYIPKTAINQNAIQRMVDHGVRAARELWRLEQQRQDLSMFAEVIVHDFKAPVRALSFLAEQIDEDLADGDMQEVSAGVKMISKSAKQMTAMIESLADHVRLDRQTEFAAADVGAIIETALTSLALDISETGAVIDVDIDPNIQQLFCDAPKISQVLQNLIANAMKFKDGPRCRITINVKEQSDGRVLFDVTDDGPGVPEAYRDRLFEPFKRMPNCKDKAGTGLGLATCRKNVLLHGGSISCCEAPTGGASFRFDIPINDVLAIQQTP